MPWHPVAFAASIVVGFWLDSVVSPYAAFRSVLLAVTIAGVLTVAFALTLRSPQRSALLVTAVIAMFFSKHVVEIAVDLRAAMATWQFILWVVLILVAVVIVARLVVRTRARWTVRAATAALNRASFLLVVATVVSGLFSGKFQHAVADLQQGHPLTDVSSEAHRDGLANASRDIYLILLDGYPRTDVLDHAFDIDNGPFEKALVERGFEIARDSHSDYLWTHVSLPSMLHMDYVENIPGLRAVMDGEAPRDPTIRDVVNDNPVFDLARSNDYQIVTTGSGFEQLSIRKADVYIDYGAINEFEIKLLVSTFLGDLLAAVSPDFASSSHRTRVETSLDSLVHVAAVDSEQPRLVFAHLPAPHQPSVFGPNGEPVTEPIGRHFYSDSPLERGEPIGQFIQKYANQITYLNLRIIETVDGILQNSDEPPVIVLWADHGSASRVDWLVTQPAEAAPDRLLERTATFFAALTPERDRIFPADISPVNIFRILSDSYFATDLGRAAAPADGGHIPPLDASVLSP